MCDKCRECSNRPNPWESKEEAIRMLKKIDVMDENCMPATWYTEMVDKSKETLDTAKQVRDNKALLTKEV